MATIIGLDYGNYYSQPVYIQNMDPKTKRGGTSIDLSDPSAADPNGIPTAFFRSARVNGGEPCVGYLATTKRPASNIVRYLKRHMRESKELDDRTYTYAHMITKTIEHCVRKANIQLHAQIQETTNLIALSYPANFKAPDRAFLVSLAQQATLEDGRRLKVVGTITEPAAAALDYLAEQPNAKPETCVMSYDLGAGTFDVSVVKAYPNGKRSASGSTYYYDVEWTDGISDLGGREFDKIIYNIVVDKTGITPKGTGVDNLMIAAERAKRDLTELDATTIQLGLDDSCEITRAEFEKAAEPQIQKTVKMITDGLAKPEITRPDLILLTGGASRMPIVKRMLEQAIPEYRGKIVSHKPSKAIALGAARFATVEDNNNISAGGSSTTQPVQQRTTLDLGIRLTDESAISSASRYYIETLIPSGTPIPCSSKEIHLSTVAKSTSSVETGVFEAVNSNPNKRMVSRDYNHVVPNSFQFHRNVPRGTPVTYQMVIDKNNILHVHVWEPDKRAQTEQIMESTYKEWNN